MAVPANLFRCPTREAIDSLAVRFGLPNAPPMQDWEWEVADPWRLDEFLAGYLSGELSADERFTIMATLLQCFESSGLDLERDPRWTRVALALDADIDLHAWTVWYWSCLERPDPAHGFRVTPYVRRIWERHRDRLERQGEPQ